MMRGFAQRSRLSRHTGQGLLHDGTQLNDGMQCFFGDANGWGQCYKETSISRIGN
jgi:hypothetical protein